MARMRNSSANTWRRHQRHYNVLYHEAEEQIERGLLGDLHYIRAQWHRGNAPGADSWQMPMPSQLKPNDKQAGKLNDELIAWKQNLAEASGLDIEKWRKKVIQKEAELSDALLAQDGSKYKGVELKTPAGYGYLSEDFGRGTKYAYERPAAEELIRWRLWKRTGGGLMVELGSHQLDAASIFLAANNSPPRCVEMIRIPLRPQGSSGQGLCFGQQKPLWPRPPGS